MIKLEMIRLAASVIGGFILLVFILRGFCLIRAGQVGILTRNMLGRKMPEGQIIARHGQVGVQAKTLMPGLYWRMPIIWSFAKVPVVTVDIASIGIVESIDGEPCQKGEYWAMKSSATSFKMQKCS